MPSRPIRPTRAGWVVLALVGTLVAGAATAGIVSLAGSVAGMLTGSPDCTVSAAGHVVELDREEAERATTAAASAVRREAGPSAVTGAVATAASLSPTDARALSAALTGEARAALTCSHGGASSSEPDRLDRQGLTGRAATVRADVRATHGAVPLGGFAPGGVTDGHMPGSAHYDGRAIDAFFRPINPANKKRGWALAHYLVAHAERLEVDTVIFDGRIWTARRADQGWRDYDVDTSGKSRQVARILEHRDHVHVDVAD